LSNLSFVLGKYWFSIFDSLPSEVYSQVWQYKRLFGEVDKNNPLTPAELKQKERIWQNNDGKNPIKAAMIDTESFLKLDFNETSSSESEVQGKIESDNWQTELEKNKEKENSGIKELSIEEYNQKYKKLIDYIMEKNFINKWNDFEWLFEWLQFSIEKNINKGTSWTAFYRVYINDWKQKIALWLRQGNTKWQVFENNFSPKLYENNNWFGVVEVVKWVEGSDLLTLVENNPTIAKEYAQAVWELLIEIEKKWYWLNDIWFKDGHNVMYDPETKIIKLIEPLNITNRRNNLFSHESSLIDQLLQNEFWTGGWMDISISAKGTFLFYLLKTLIDKKWYDIISNMDQPNKKAYKWTLEFQINDMMWFEYLPIQRDIEWEYVVLKWQTNKIDERVIEAIKNNDINEFKKIYENNKIVLTWNTTNTIEVHHNDYFWKESRFWFDSKQARDHSAFMDQFTTHATPEQIAQIREKIQAVGQMYTDKTGKAFTLTDAQIQAIIATHLKPGELGKLTQAELRAKVQELATAISDTDVRRFLLEAGFCGMSEKIINTLNHAIKELNTFFSSTNWKTKKQLQQSFTLLQEKYNYHELYHDALRKELWKKIDQLSKERDNLILQYKVSLRTYDEMTEGIQWFLNHFKSKRLKEDIDILEIVIGKKAVGIKDIKADYVLIEDIQKWINNHDTLISNILKVEKITSSLWYDFGLGSRIQNLLLDSLQNNTDHSFEFSLLFWELEYIKKLEDIIEWTRYSIEKDAQWNYLVLDVEWNNIIDKQTPNNDTEIIENYIRSMAGSQSTSKLSSLWNHHNMNLSNYHLSEWKNINIVRRLSFPQLMEWIGGNHIPLWYGRESVSIGNGNETFGFFSQTELNDTKKNKDIMGENQDIYKDTGIGIRYGHKDAFSEFSKEINSLYSFASEISGSWVVVPWWERWKESNFFWSQNLFTDRLWSDTKYGKIYLDMPVYDNDWKQQIIWHSVTSMFDAWEVKIYSNRLPKGTKVYVQFGQIIDGKLDIQSISNGFQTKADYDYFVQCLQDKGVEFWWFMVRDNTKSWFHTLFRDDLIVLQTNHKHMNFEQLSQERWILSKDVIKKNIEVGIKNDIVVSNINSELLQWWKNYLQKENSIKDKIKMLTNSLVFDAKNIRSAIDNDWSFSPETAKFNDYFWKESRFWFDSKQARDHSTFMDQFTTQATAEQIAQIREKIQAVGQMYTDKTGKAFTLTDAQIQAIIATHILPWQLGSLTQAEILVKNRKLAETIPDGNMRRFLLEAGFCGMEEFAVNAVNRIKSRKEKRTPMRAVLALNALIMLNSVDNVKTKILHKSIDVTQHMYTSLEKQSRDIQAVEQWFTKKIEQSKEQFDEMVSTYKNFLETVKHYNNTWLWQWINRISNGAIDETIAKAEEWKYALENTQNIVWDVNTMMQEIKTRTDASLQIAENMKNALNNAHDITDLTLNILQIISLITLLYQVFYAYGLYHSKEWKVKEQQVMMKNMKIGIVASAISLLAFYGKINPEMQSWSNEVTQQLQTLDDMIVVANSDAQNISNNQANDNYFWKESRFWFDSKQARDHSVFMDQFTGQARPEQITQIREKIQVVAQIYTDKTGKTLELTDAQIQTIIATHLKPGELGKLTQAELKVKVQELATAIPDADVRRFLLEAGFCGIWWKFQENIKTIFTNWILKSNEKVNYSNVSPDLINDYSQYHESVGVEEGYTLLEHTNMVLGQFDKYFWERFDFGVVTKNYFRDLLMIHDIWKPIAHKIWNKDDQHIYSKPLIEKILIDKWYTKNLVNFGVDLMTMDPIGWYLQWKYTLDESINIIKETYSKSWNLLSIDKYFDLLKIYYLSDTSSYTTDANWISSLDHLFDFNSWLLLNNSLQSKVDIMKNKLIWDVIWNNILNVQDRNLNLLEESEKITDMISFKSFFEKLSFEGKKSLLMDYLAKLPPIYSKEINILDISDKNCAKGWLLLYCWDRSHHMNERLEISSFGRNEVFGFLWRYFLEYWLKHNLYVTYNHNKNLYRDIIIDPDKQSDLLEEILWLHAWGIYMDKGLFSTTLKPHSTFSEEYYNEERWKWLEYFKEKAIQKVELRYQNDQLEEISNKVKKENGEAIFELDLLWDNMTSDQRRTSSLQKIHSGEFIKEVKNYAVRFIVVNSKGWIDIENNIQTVHSDKENEILFWPNKVWKVLKSKFDTKKKKILIFIDGS
jgi:hypothetical protein